MQLGLRIHEVIAGATRNGALVKLSGQVYQQLRVALWLEVLWVDWEEVGLAEHKAIAEAIIARDAAAAGNAARAHVRTSLRNMNKVEEIYSHKIAGSRRLDRPL